MGQDSSKPAASKEANKPKDQGAKQPTAPQPEKSSGSQEPDKYLVRKASFQRSEFITKAFESRPSILSADNLEQNYRGFINVLIILLVLGNFEKMLQNAAKYGILFNKDFLKSIDKSVNEWPNLVLSLSLLINYSFAWGMDYWFAKFLPEGLRITVQLCNAVMAFVGPASAIWILDTTPMGAVACLCMASITMMKLISFSMNSSVFRQEDVSKDKKPHLASLNHFIFFIAAPTMVYARSYPRTERFRKRWLMFQIAEFIACWLGIVFISVQYVMPGINTSLPAMKKGQLLLFVQGWFKVAVPNFVVWILGFYSIFHLYLNIVAELIGYSDRMFYKDWWNSTTLEYFWKTWNLPVHQWIVAQIYIPMVNRGYKQSTAGVVAFFYSAVMHELIVAVPFRNFKLLAFGGMMIQVVLVQVSKPFKGRDVGNVVFWLSIILGQPYIVMLYFRDYARGRSPSTLNPKLPALTPELQSLNPCPNRNPDPDPDPKH